VSTQGQGSKELSQLEILTSFMTKRLLAFREKCAKVMTNEGSSVELKTDQHKILRDLVA